MILSMYPKKKRGVGKHKTAIKKKTSIKNIIKSHYKQTHCTPFKDRLPYSCLSRSGIHIIAKALDKMNDIDIIQEGVSDKELYHNICNMIQDAFKCKNEACWLNISKLKNQLSKKDFTLLEGHFRPDMPGEIVEDDTAWISNFDIEEVLNQFHNNVDSFYSYGAVPIDFSKCSVSDLCKIDIGNHLTNNETKIGIVFNTDKSGLPGKHWMSMFIDLLGSNLNGDPGIYFFDSFGEKPSKEINDLIQKLQSQGKQHSIEFVVANNDKSFQKNNYSCGFYCMHFLEHMVRGLPFHKYLQSGLNDKKMIDYQRHCYLHPDEIKY